MEKQGKVNPMPMLVSLVVMYVLTSLLLLVMAFLLGKVDMTDGAVNIGIIVIYIVSCFAGGFLIGKKQKTKKYLWGFVLGALYFLVLLGGNLIVNRGISGMELNMLATAIMCTCSGMAGGMLS